MIGLQQRRKERLSRFNRQKRVIDLTLLCVSAPLTLPVILVVAAASRIIQGPDVFFRQQRIGYQGETFELLKFRTMKPVADEELALKPDRSRLTGFGSFLRKTSLDELPQLLNVLRGDMSLVGPRPLLARYKDYYTARETIRHQVRPGLTGYSQLHRRNVIGWDLRLEGDVYYVERASLLLDLQIMIRSISSVLRRQNVAALPRERGGRMLDVYRSFPSLSGWTLRPLQANDLPTRVEWLNNQQTARFMTIEGSITQESTAEWFDRHQQDPAKHDLVMVSVDDGTLGAMLGVSDSQPREGTTFVLVSPDHRGQGLGTLSKMLLCEWAFVHRGYTSLRAQAHKLNTASIRMNKRVGAVVESESEQHYHFVITEENYRAAKAVLSDPQSYHE